MAKKTGSKGGNARGRQEAELEALRRRVIELEQLADKAEPQKGLTKREIAKASAWVTPIILAVNMPQAVFAGSATSPVAAPTAAPSSAPSVAPSSAPTTAPPFGAPTAAPTVSPPTTAPPFGAPTAAPTGS